MRKLICVLAGIALFAAPALGQGAAFRLYLSEQGVEGNTPLSGVTPAQTNPLIVDPAGGTHRLYVWGQVIGAETPQKYILVGYNSVTPGSASVVGPATGNYPNTPHRGARSSNHSWSLPSIWMSSPRHARRRRGGCTRRSRGLRGVHSSASTIHCRTVVTDTSKPCCSTSFSRANVGPKSA